MRVAYILGMIAILSLLACGQIIRVIYLRNEKIFDKEKWGWSTLEWFCYIVMGLLLVDILLGTLRWAYYE